MKNFSAGLSIAALLGVVVLFYLHFSGKGNTTGFAGTKAVPTGNFKIAYFESDSIQNNFEYFKEIRAALQAKDQANSKQLNELKNIFASKYQDLQKSGNMLSQAELANKQQELAQLEKTYQGKEQMMAQEMQDESFKKLQDVKRKIEDYLKEYNKDKGYAYVFSSAPEFMYLKDSAYNITNDLVKGLNKLYPKKQ
ncbi:MAG: OmpH family outer membrane protein [Sediminibacterium sp.]|nr:OmpH family outer membrane protein [Sediminibacterium sp.]MBX9779078.1 OmpH family outer membrane protein [Chitinophagaceae bacterium]